MKALLCDNVGWYDAKRWLTNPTLLMINIQIENVQVPCMDYEYLLGKEGVLNNATRFILYNDICNHDFMYLM